MVENQLVEWIEYQEKYRRSERLQIRKLWQLRSPKYHAMKDSNYFQWLLSIYVS